jgi:FAD:protein FMN transferase
MFNYPFNSMSTTVQISINHELFANDMMPVYKLFQSIEETCSRFRADSELSLLNQQIGKEVNVSSEMFSILTVALRFYEETAGIFNPDFRGDRK